jgi:AcrR family transcriptional regulator
MKMVMNDHIKPTKTYHHGDLRRALLDAAEMELIEKGTDKFSLRSIAKRAGVSHAAPAHHFSDVDGLLTALTSISFRRFHDAMYDASEKASGDTNNDPYERLVAIGMAYINYAEQNSAMFDLQFTSNRIDHCSPEIKEVAPLSYQCLVNHVTAVLEDKGKSMDKDVNAANSYWALCHGLAALFARPKPNMKDAPPREEFDARFKSILQTAAHNL